MLSSSTYDLPDTYAVFPQYPLKTTCVEILSREKLGIAIARDIYMREQKLKTITDNLASVNASQYMHLKSTSILYIYVCQFSTITTD